MSQELRTRPAARSAGAPPADHHRNVAEGNLVRAAVFGVSDGLLTNVSLILGVAGANPAPGVVRLAGVAGLVAGAFSMAAGEFVSVSAQRELIERELRLERREIERHPESERRELVGLYVDRGLTRSVAEEVATTIMQDPKTALEVHAREELGVDPGDTGSPLGAALSSFVAFALGAAVPLVPWFPLAGWTAAIVAIALSAVLATAIGVTIGAITGRSPVRAGARQLGIAILATAVTFGIGHLVGTGVST